eukprot:1076587-Amphidinium_carterae.1
MVAVWGAAGQVWLPYTSDCEYHSNGILTLSMRSAIDVMVMDIIFNVHGACSGRTLLTGIKLLDKSEGFQETLQGKTTN